MGSNKLRVYNKLIVAVSILVPVVVALLLFIKWENDELIFNMRMPNYDPIILLDNLPIVKPLTFLPPIYASINGLTAILLIISVQLIKKKKRKLHELLMKICIGLSLLFLVMYIAYHMTSDPTPYGGEGAIKYVYFFILISHILLSIAVIPFVLITYVRAITNDIVLHKKIAKITFPLWLYVAVTGVIVYLMISPYY